MIIFEDVLKEFKQGLPDKTKILITETSMFISLTN